MSNERMDSFKERVYQICCFAEN